MKLHDSQNNTEIERKVLLMERKVSVQHYRSSKDNRKSSLVGFLRPVL